MTLTRNWFSCNHGCRAGQQLMSAWHQQLTTTTLSTTTMLVLLSLFTTSSFAVASPDVGQGRIGPRSTSIASTRPLTRPDAGPTSTTPSARVERPPAGRPSPATGATTPPPPSTTTTTTIAGRDVYVRSRPETEVDRSTYEDGGVQRASNWTTRRPHSDDEDDDDDGLRRRRFHRISAAQSSSGSAVRRLSSSGRRHQSPAGPSVTTRLLYGALALVVASVLTPLLCLAAGLARNRLARYVDRRRRFDKTGEYERVDSVSSVVDSSSLYAGGGSQSQLDVYVDDPLVIEDVTII